VNLFGVGDYWSGFLSMLDNLLIVLYGVTGDPLSDYFLGTFLAALLTVIIGEFTISVVYLVNRKHLEGLNVTMATHHNLSIAALKSGDKKEYQVQNKQASDAFGKVFSTRLPWALLISGRVSSFWRGCKRGLRISGSPFSLPIGR
jgi:hypothetical protein